MKSITLSQGMSTQIDDADYGRVNAIGWYAFWNGRHWYAVRNIRVNGRGGTEYLHRFIVGASGKAHVDHINGDTLNNCRDNLRLATCAENCRNRGKTLSNTSGHKGVSWNKRTEKWKAFIRVNYRQISLGEFFNKTLAALAYDDAAMKYFGEFAKLNFA